MESRLSYTKNGWHQTLPNKFKTFHLFRSLPAELRLKIWHYSLPPSRLVQIKYTGSSISSHKALDATLQPLSGYRSPAVIPTILHVCRESRMEALRDYKLRFGMACHPNKTFFDTAEDVLFFGPRSGYMASVAQFSTFLALSNSVDLALVQKIAINEAIFCNAGLHNPLTSKRLTEELIRNLCLRMPKLRYIFVLIRDYNPVYRSDVVPVPSPEPQHDLETRIGASITALHGQIQNQQWPEWQISVLSARSERCE